MSNFHGSTSSGQFDEMRRIQEEIRRHVSLTYPPDLGQQQKQNQTKQKPSSTKGPTSVPQPSGVPPTAPAHPSDSYSQHLIAAAVNHQQRQQQSNVVGTYTGYPPPNHAAYGTPYGTAGIADYQQQQQQPVGSGSQQQQLAQIYAAHQERQRHAAAAVAASVGNYGYGGTTGGGPVTSPEQHHYAAYGVPQPAPPAGGYSRDSPYGMLASTPAQSSPYHDVSMVQNHHHLYMSSQKQQKKSSNSAINAIKSNKKRESNDPLSMRGSVLKVNTNETPTSANTNSSTNLKATPTSNSSSSPASDEDGSPESDEFVDALSRKSSLATENMNETPRYRKNSSELPTSKSWKDLGAGTPKNSLSPKSSPFKGKIGNGFSGIDMEGRKLHSNINDNISGGSKASSPNQNMLVPSNSSTAARIVVHENGITYIEDGEQRWFTGCVPLGVDDDKYWLSELQVYLRSNFAEAFGATDDDIAAPMHGRNKPIALGQVGIRCMHCKNDNPSERGQQATSYPSLISGIYNSVQQMLRLHLDCCTAMPPDVRAKIEQLKISCSSRGGRKQYWIDSARRLGLVDTMHGIHFGRDPHGPLPPLAGPSVNSKEGRSKKKVPGQFSSSPSKGIMPGKETDPTMSSPSMERICSVASGESPIVSFSFTQKHPRFDGDGVVLTDLDKEGTDAVDSFQHDRTASPPKQKQTTPTTHSSTSTAGALPVLPTPPTPPSQPPADSRPLVFPEDKSLISDYLYLTLEQMAPCSLMEADRVGCYKTRKVGFPGLACKHCTGQAGCGRYFPASEASLSQTTTSQTIMNHVRNCRRCPLEIRENLEIMKRNRMGPDGKRADKPKHGGRKVFFHRLWCRIQDLPFEEGRAERKEGKKRINKKHSPRKKSRGGEDDSEDDSDDDEDDDDDRDGSVKSNDDSSDAASEDSDSVKKDDDGTSSDAEQSALSSPKHKAVRSKPTIAPLIGTTGNLVTKSKKSRGTQWFTGCVRLTKSDDPHWLSEMECFARSDLVEVFSYKIGDSLEGYTGRRIPNEGQVGIRCVFCKQAHPDNRTNGCITFPETMSSIHSKIGDMIRLHFPSCKMMPEKAIQTFKRCRGFDAKVANDDSQQFWVDSARDIGLSNCPSSGSHGHGGLWGITFRRDPLQPSPADELDWEQSSNNGSDTTYNNNLSLVRPEDRGLCTDQGILLLRQVQLCRFQTSDRRAGPGSKGRDRPIGFPGLCCIHCVGRSTSGRYFPVSAKNLTDMTTTSLQAHILSCAFCPENIKASLAYLGHRSILQKAELSGSWKKIFFKKVWERLHADTDKSTYDDPKHKSVVMFDGETDKSRFSKTDDDTDHDDAHNINHLDIGDDNHHGSTRNNGYDDDQHDDGSINSNEDLGEHMNALIKAAAIWLTEQDNADSKGGAKSGNKRTSNIPSISSSIVSRTGGGISFSPTAAASSSSSGLASAGATKRRRVNSS